MRNDAKMKRKHFCFDAKKAVFSLVSLRSGTLEIKSETKANEAKKAKRNETEQENCEIKYQKIGLILSYWTPHALSHRRKMWQDLLRTNAIPHIFFGSGQNFAPAPAPTLLYSKPTLGPSCLLCFYV
jgi:hypothetical protein